MFNASVPVTADAFRNRRKELGRLMDAVQSLAAGRPRWVCVLGVRKIGKTSLLLELARRNTDARIAFVAVDAFESLPSTAEVFRRQALRALDVMLGPETGVSLEALSIRPAEYRGVLAASPAFTTLPAGLRAELLELPDRAMDAEGIRAMAGVPERLAKARGRYCVAVWDEFQEIAAARSGRTGIDLPALLRSVWQTHARTAYIISGSARGMLEGMVARKGSPFFQHFEVVDLGPFARDDAVELLVAGGRIPRGIAEEAYTTIGGNPFYLQLLGEALEAQGREGDAASLKDAYGELLFSRTGRLALYFESEFQRIVGRATTLAATLEALAEGPRRLSEIAATIRAKTGATAGYLERLGDAVVRDDDGRYRLVDIAFGLWLRWRRPGGTVVPMTVLGDEAEKRTADALARMGFDLVYQSRASRGAFDLLATRGPRQVGIQVKRSALPLRVPLAAWRRMEADASRLGWRWALAAVTPAPGEAVLFLDPGRARRAGAVVLTQRAVIENFLAWADRADEPRRRRR